MSFSLPGELCKIALKDKDGKNLRVITVYAAWNLLSVTDNGRSVLGSNRRFAAAVIRKLEESQPEYMRKQRETYGDQLSGKFVKEYWEILKGEQATPITWIPGPPAQSLINGAARVLTFPLTLPERTHGLRIERAHLGS